MADLVWIWTLLLALVTFAAALFLIAARRRALSPPGKHGYRAPAGDSRIVPEPPPPVPPEDEESLDVWGFRDTRYFVNDRGHVEISGNRYEMSGCEMPNLAPWIREVMGVEVDPHDLNTPHYPPALPEPRIDEPFLADLRQLLSPDQISRDPRIRLRHGHGHTQEEMFAIKYGTLGRIPDLVAYPESEDQVVALVQAALRHDACLIPYGGGTNVTDALRCPEDEKRTIVSVDMQRMNRILWIDPLNRMARIQAGAVGRNLMAQLEEHGLTMGHEPDSVEFSTLGGWVATHCSGMKKNRYGNIEDLVLDVTAVTPQGKLERTAVAPRESVGVDPRRWLYGSEGNLGIVTSAVVKVFPLPEVQRFGSFVFPSYEDGIAFMYDLMREENLPASVRLVDNMQFQFSMALKPRATGWRATKSRVEKWAITRLLGYDPQRMVACTLLFEGRRREVAGQQSAVSRIARRHGGMKSGGENGRRGYQLTFSIAYIRDFVMNHYLLGESFETSVPWDRILDVCRNVETRLREEYSRRELPGRPFLCSRVTQIYQTGVCVYFYFGICYKGVEDPSRVYAEMEVAARQAIIDAGGSLSHHHGIGKLRERFLPQIMSPAVQEWNRSTKRAIDPRNVFGSRNQGVTP